MSLLLGRATCDGASPWRDLQSRHHHRTDAHPGTRARMSLRVPSTNGVVRVTPQTAGWGYVGFEVARVEGRLERREAGRETCVVVLAGTCDLAAGDVAGSSLGRSSVFEGPPVALYVPPGMAWSADGDAELALCTAPAEGGLAPRLLASPTLLMR